MDLQFAKYHGAGNDFVLVDNRAGHFDPTRERVAALCHRRFGVGADGLMTLERDPLLEFRMRYFKADGGESTMCGNGGRCIALFAEHLGIGGRVKEFMGSDGPHSATVDADGADGGVVTLRMVDVAQVVHEQGFFFLNTGSPHYVEFVDDLDGLDVDTLGREIRRDGAFAEIGGTNVNFVRIDGYGRIAVRTYERGVEAETWACGTGATAAAIAAHLYRFPNCLSFGVDVRGGELRVAFRTVGDGFTDVMLTGPARRVFSGVIDPDGLVHRAVRF